MSRNALILSIVPLCLLVYFLVSSSSSNSSSTPHVPNTNDISDDKAATTKRTKAPTTNSPIITSVSSTSSTALIVPVHEEPNNGDDDNDENGSSSVCPLRSNSYRALGTFPFWGKAMNETWSCPASGMNNQLTLFLSYWYCFEQRQRSLTHAKSKTNHIVAGFRWKDITCSPTGGKEGSRRFVVGSDDYIYAWFRWSEVFRVLPKPRFIVPTIDANSKPRREDLLFSTTLCFHDKYTWKEHPELGNCQSNIGGHLYGTTPWWELRGRIEPHRRFTAVMKCFFASALAGSNSKLFDMNECLRKPTATMDSNVAHGVLGIHVRRGDYTNFCKGLIGSSAMRKFRVPPYKWLSKVSTALSRRFLDTCAPSDSVVLRYVRRIVSDYQASKSPIKVVYVASNSQSFVRDLRDGVSKAIPELKVVSLADVLKVFFTSSSPSSSSSAASSTHAGGDLQWPAAAIDDSMRRPEFKRARSVSLTDKVMLDIVGLALCDAVVLNRYSTFSQSVVDERVLFRASAMTASPVAAVNDDWVAAVPGMDRVWWW